MTNEEMLKMPHNAFKDFWQRYEIEKSLRAVEDRRQEELKFLMACLCDGCRKYKGVQACELYGECSQTIAEHLLSLGWHRMDSTVSEAFAHLTEKMKESVSESNVDFFSEVKCYMVQIEHDYIKRCYPRFNTNGMEEYKNNVQFDEP